MPDLSGARHIHLIGVGGTGMGTFGGLLKVAGYHVTGSDERVYPPMSDMLAKWGIGVREPYHPQNLDDEPDLVVVGNVCRRDNPEAAAARERGLTQLSMARALRGLFLEGRHSVVVAGTHGKTTTTALLGSVLASAGRDPGVLVGGVVRDFGGSFRLGKGETFVVEGDEYDTVYWDKGPKLFHYAARTAILTNVEFDHADIYGDLAQVEYAFARWAAMIPTEGALAYCIDDAGAKRVAEAHATCELVPYGLGKGAAVRARDVDFTDGGTRFALVVDGSQAGRIESPLTGEHNLRNSLGVTACALSLGLSVEEIAAGIRGFQGIVKRQEVKGIARGVTVVDDFAHHPTAVRETLKALRLRYAGRRLLIAFEAKSNTSRMNVFHEDYVAALSLADVVVIARPYVKKDKIPPERRLDVARLAAEVQASGVPAHLIPDVGDIVSFLVGEAREGDVVAGLSGSDFGGFHEALLAALRGEAKEEEEEE